MHTLVREMKDESTSLFSATVISLMTEDFTLDELAELPLEAFSDLIQEKGRGSFQTRENCQGYSTSHQIRLSLRHCSPRIY